MQQTRQLVNFKFTHSRVKLKVAAHVRTAYAYTMRTIAVNVDDEVYSKAEQKAVALSTSVPAVVADYLRQWVSDEDRLEDARRKMTQLFTQPGRQFGVGNPDSREERNARR